MTAKKTQAIEKAAEKVGDKLDLQRTGKAVDHTPIDVYARKIWVGQSVSLNAKERERRVKNALRNQGYDLRSFKVEVLHDE